MIEIIIIFYTQKNRVFSGPVHLQIEKSLEGPQETTLNLKCKYDNSIQVGAPEYVYWSYKKDAVSPEQFLMIHSDETFAEDGSGKSYQAYNYLKQFVIPDQVHFSTQPAHCRFRELNIVLNFYDVYLFFLLRVVFIIEKVPVEFLFEYINLTVIYHFVFSLYNPENKKSFVGHCSRALTISTILGAGCTELVISDVNIDNGGTFKCYVKPFGKDLVSATKDIELKKGLFTFFPVASSASLIICVFFNEVSNSSKNCKFANKVPRFQNTPDIKKAPWNKNHK